MPLDTATTLPTPATLHPAHAFAARLLRLRDGRQSTINDRWTECRESPRWDTETFLTIAHRLTGHPATFCEDCGGALWENAAEATASGTLICERCASRDYYYCRACRQLDNDVTWIDDHAYCESCRTDHCYFCDRCDEWVRNSHDHPDCDCEAPHTSFTFPANGDGTVENDSRLTVTLPAGVIDDIGLGAIARHIRDTVGWNESAAVWRLDARWQMHDGNFTRRLSRAVFQDYGTKLAPSVVSEVGNLARQHSSGTSTWRIEFTRLLNDTPSAFVHSRSCWWTEHVESRCALKTWGGLGLRTYQGDEPSWQPSGRAWVLPLDASLQPTHDTHAPAYVVFNEYGDVEGYVAARIVAHLTGKTYRRIDFTADPMYVNGDRGVLVADQALCDATCSVRLVLEPHSSRAAA